MPKNNTIPDNDVSAAQVHSITRNACIAHFKYNPKFDDFQIQKRKTYTLTYCKDRICIIWEF